MDRERGRDLSSPPVNDDFIEMYDRPPPSRSIHLAALPLPLSPRGNASLQVVFHEKAGKRERDPKARVSSLEDFELGEGGGDDAASPRFERGGI